MANRKMKPEDRYIDDPEFGRVEMHRPPPTKAEWDDAQRTARASVKLYRAWPKGSLNKCPSCGKMTLEGRDDLQHQVVRPGRVFVFRNLSGGRCTKCSAQVFETQDLIAIEDAISEGFVGDYEAKVSTIGRGTLGTYWPKDVVRVLHLNSDKRVLIQVVDPNTALLRFKPRRPAHQKRNKPIPRT